MIAEAVLDLVCSVLSRTWSPPAPPPPLIEFVRQFRWTEGFTVKRGEGDQIDPTKHVPHYLALQAIGDALNGRGRYRHIVAPKCTQDGGTWIFVTMPLLYCTTQLGHPAVAGFPDMRLAGVAWRQKMRAPIMKAGRSTWLPTEGPGSDGNSTPVEVALCSVPLYFIGGGASNEAGQAMLSGMLLTRDERDAMEPAIAELMSSRTGGFDNRAVIIDISSIKADIEEDSQIWQEFLLSTAFRLAWPCPHCGGYQLWDWDRMRCDRTSQRTAMETVHLLCAHEDCKRPITDAQRIAAMNLSTYRLVGRGQELQRDGSVAGIIPDTTSWGLLWSALDSPIKSLAKLAEEYWAAEQALRIGEHAKMRAFYRDRLCCFYKGAAAGSANLDATNLALRSARSTYARRVVPPGATFVTVAGDVQEHELWWLAIAHGPGNRWWIIDFGRQVVGTGDGREEPSIEDRMEALDAVAAQVGAGWSDAEGKLFQPLMKAWDSRYKAAIVKDWIAEQNGSWLQVRGSGEGQHSEKPSGRRITRIEGWIDVREIDDQTIIHYAESNCIKDILQEALARDVGVLGAGHLYQGEAADGYLIKQLTSERKIDGTWVKKKRDNHLWDCAVYNLSLGKYAAEHLAGVVPAAAAAQDLVAALDDLPRRQRRF